MLVPLCAVVCDADTLVSDRVTSCTTALYENHFLAEVSHMMQGKERTAPALRDWGVGPSNRAERSPIYSFSVVKYSTKSYDKH